MGALAAVLIVLCTWSVIALRQFNRLSDSAAGLAMIVVCFVGFFGCFGLGISLVVPALALTALAFGSAILWSFGYLQ